MTLQFKVVHQTIHPANRDPYAHEVVSDSVGYLHTQFTFDSNWDGLIKSAVFLGANGLAYRIPLDLSGTCLVPHEVIKAPYLKITVIGSNLEDEVYSLPTAPYQLKIKQSGMKDGEIPEDPTPETYAIVVDIMRQQAVEAVAALEAQTAAELARDETVDILENITDEIVPAITEDADRSEAKADLSTTQATKSESYAVGGTGSREGENEDNSKHYSGVSLQAMTDFLAMLGKDIATLTDGKLTPSQIPALSINDVFDVASEAELLTLTAERGDCALVIADDVVTDSYILAADDPTEMSNWKKLGVSYVANAGHSVTADNATNADKINNKRIVSMTQAQYDIAALDDDTYYYVDPEPDEPEV